MITFTQLNNLLTLLQTMARGLIVRPSLSLKKLLGFFESAMLQLFDFELRPIDQMVPFDRDAR
jgi:hypothetical protein